MNWPGKKQSNGEDYLVMGVALFTISGVKCLLAWDVTPEAGVYLTTAAFAVVVSVSLRSLRHIRERTVPTILERTTSDSVK